MALVTANQFQLVPELSRLGSGFQQGQQIRAGLDARQLAQQQAQQTAQSQQFAGQALTGDKAALGDLAGVDPQKAIQIQSFLANQSEADRAEGLRENEVLTRTALGALSLPPEQRRNFLTAKREEFAAAGRDTTNIDGALAGDDNALNQALTLQAQQGQTIADLAKRQFPSGATSGQKLFKTLTEGLTQEQELEARLIKLGINPRAVSSADITIAQSPQLTEQIADSKAIINERKKFGELTGSSRAKKIDAGFERIQKIDTGISNINRAIALINEGASTGAVEGLFPSITAATVALNNLQSTMALDVIGAVTFGALSQGELDLAKTVALNTKLKGPELIRDLEGRRQAQEKLRDYFNEQIQFLDQGGTVAGFLRKKEATQEQQQQPPASIARPAEVAPASFNSTALGRQVSEQDIADTLQANTGLTREQLFQQLGIQ